MCQQYVWILLWLELFEQLIAVDYVVFTGDTYKKLFTEAKESANQSPIKLYLDGRVLLDTATVNGGWYVEEVASSSQSSVYLRNDLIKLAKSNFSMKVVYALKVQQVLSFYVLNAAATKDFNLSSSTETLSLWCSSSPIAEETIQDMFWAVETENGNFVQINSTSDGLVSVQKSESPNNTVTLTFHGSDDVKRYPHGVSEPLAAYSGKFGCHIKVKTSSNSVVHGTLHVTVSSKPAVGMYILGEGHYLTGHNAEMLCVADGYPISDISWTLSHHKKSLPLSQATSVQFEAIQHDGKKYFISIDNRTAVNGLNARVHSILRVRNLRHLEDRGFYRCRASNSLGYNHSSLYLRIRYQYTYLIPLIGIAVNLLIFVACIVMFEKFKASTYRESEFDSAKADGNDHNIIHENHSSPI